MPVDFSSLPVAGSDDCGIYAIVNSENGKFYLGSAVSVGKRIQGHYKNLKAGSHHSKHFQAAWSKYGKEAFTVRLVERVANASELLAREDCWLALLQPYKRDIGYNVAMFATAIMRGRKLSESARKKISDFHRGRKIGPRSPEFIAKMSAARKGRPVPHLIEAARRANTGKPLSDERRKKIGDAQRGRKGHEWTPEERAAQSARKKGCPGRIWTDEQRAAKSAALKGRTPPPAAFTPAAIQKRADRQRGVPKKPESIEKMRASKTGKPWGGKRGRAPRKKTVAVRKTTDWVASVCCICGYACVSRRSDVEVGRSVYCCECSGASE